MTARHDLTAATLAAVSQTHRPETPALNDAGVPTANVTTSRGRPRDRGADDRILLATFEQLVRVGYAGLSIEAVAAEAGVAKTTVYRRYPAKRDLVVAALREEAPFPPVPADLPAREALDRFIRQAIAAFIDSGAMRILGSLLVEDQREPGLLDVFRQRLLGPRREIVLTMLRRGIERGEIRPDIDPLVVTEMVAGAIFGHHVILGLTATDDWVDSLEAHIWAAIAAR